ncbi:hypothetical protein G7Z17_g11492 [Cylindrodendrum hubeiense]|uniref:Uncharacterized protein n=1 Tax=Cylindrodendrum hubeiense TaxID=595255 RepID=A0A9P5GVS9_9HYPO|nr:hypothetical protein G7Z17_g11492 [Cylindrodendrum hubeiense]
MAKLDVVTLDSNVWYHVTEARVDDYDKDNFTSSFQVEDDNGVAVWGFVDHYWQFQPVKNGPAGRYALRCSRTGVFKQLSACYVEDEIDDSKTEPCMVASDGTKAQMWDIADWGNSTYRFINVKNGSDYVMDVHPGNPPFMSSDLRTNIPQPGRHWLMTSVRDVDDGAYSTTFTKVPSATAADVTTTTETSSSETTTTDSAASESTTSSASSSSSISTGAAAGIGIGVGLAVLGLGLGLFFLWWRRRQSHRNRAATEMPSNDTKSPPPASYNEWYPLAPPQEMSSERNTRSELDSMPVWGSTVEPTPVRGSNVDSTPAWGSNVDSTPAWGSTVDPTSVRGSNLDPTPVWDGPVSPKTLKSSLVPSRAPTVDGGEGSVNSNTGDTHRAH